MNNKFSVLTFIASFLLAMVSIYGQGIHTQYRFKYLTIDEGLSNNRSSSVTKDSLGFVWIATDDGVSRFDGIHVKKYNTYLNNDKDQWNQHVTSVFTDRSGNLWKGALNLFKFDYSQDKFVLVFDENDQDQPQRIKAIIQNNDHEIWVGARNGIFKLNTTTHERLHLPPDLERDSLYYQVWDLTKQQNKFWIGTRNYGLVVYDMKRSEYRQIDLINEKNEKVYIVLCTYIDDKNNTAWIGTKNNGIFKVNTISEKVMAHEYPDSQTRRIRDIVGDDQGNIWIGTMEGLFVVHKNSGNYIRYAHTYHDFSQLSHNSIFNIYIDNHDMMWLNTYAGGINFTDLMSKPFALYTSQDDNNQFLNNAIVAGFAKDNQNNVYVGTDRGGLNILDSDKGKFSYIKHGKNGLTGSNIKCLMIDDEQRVWIGTYVGGINIYNPKNKSIESIMSSHDTADILTDNTVYSLAFDSRNDQVWVGTKVGVDVVDKNTLAVKQVLHNDRINQVYCDNSGNVYTGATGKGVFKYDRETNTFEPFFAHLDIKSIYSIHKDTRNRLWFGGKDGLSVIDLNDSSFFKYTRENGLPSNNVFGILEDNQSNLWVSTSSGLVKCEKAVSDPARFNMKIYTTKDGLQSNQFWRNAAYKSEDGQLYFGGVNGFNSFYPKNIKDNPYKPDIAFTNFKLYNKSLEIGQEVDGKVILKSDINTIDKLLLDTKQKVFTIEFQSLHYANAEQNQYAYRLDPMDKEWNYTTHPRNFVTYTSLPGGKYTFRVKAANSDGIWNHEPISLNIHIIPPFWKTNWFMITIILILISLVILMYYIRVKTIERRNVILEMTVHERTQEISLINDELLNQKEKLQELNNLKDTFFSIIAHDLKNPFNSLLGFASILDKGYNSLSDARRMVYIQTMNKSAHKIYDLLENLLTWAQTQTRGISFNPENTDLSKIIAKNIYLVEEKIATHGIQIHNIVCEPILVYADEDMLHFIIRNLLNNAIKFSGDQTTIEIWSDKKEDFVQVAIKDQGMGMNQDQIENLFTIGNKTSREGVHGEKGTGLGLIICNEFIQKHKGDIYVISEPKKGSTFYFTLPGPKPI